MRRHRRSSRTFALLAVLAATITCTDELVIPDAKQRVRATVTLQAWPDTLLAAEPGVLRVIIADSLGRRITDAPVAWASDDTSVVWVDTLAHRDTVQFEARGPGQTTITVSVGGGVFVPTDISQSVDVVLSGVSVLSPGDTSVIPALGDTLIVNATGRGYEGAPVQGSGLSWSRSGSAFTLAEAPDGDAATVVSDANGSGWIRVSHNACSGDCTDSVFVRVEQKVATVEMDRDSVSMTSLGDTIRVAVAEALDSRGHAVPGVSTSWESSDTLVATVDSTGLATAVGNGTAALRASVQETTDSIPVRVAQVVDTVQIALDSVGLLVGDTLTFDVVVLDANAFPVAGALPDWSSSDEAVASVDDAGLVIALGLGFTTVTATAGTKADSVGVSVAVLADSVDVAPDTLVLHSLGATGSLAASAFAAGSAVPGKVFAWHSPDTLVVRLQGRGLVEGVANGSGRVVASVDGIADTSYVIVEQVPDSVAVTPTSATVVPGDSVDFGAEVYDALGVSIADAAVAWASSDTAVAHVDSTGLAFAEQPGEVVIIATAGAAMDSAALVVTAEGIGPVDPHNFADGFEGGLESWWSDFSTKASPTVVVAADAPEGSHVFECDVPAPNALGYDCAAEVLGLNTDSVGAWRLTFQAKDFPSDDNGWFHVAVGAGGRSEPPDVVDFVEFGAGAFAGDQYYYRYVQVGGDPQLTGVQREDEVFHSFDITSDGVDVIVRIDDDIVGALPGKAMVAEWIAAGVGGPTKKFHLDDVRFVASDTINVLDSLFIVPPADSLQAVGDTVTLEARVLAADGDTIPGLPLTWSSLDTTVATVDSTGLVTVVALGTTGIAASYRMLADTAYIINAPDPSDFSDGFEDGLGPWWTDFSTKVTPTAIAAPDAPEGTMVFECDVPSPNETGWDCAAEVLGLNQSAIRAWRLSFQAKDFPGDASGWFRVAVGAGTSSEPPGVVEYVSLVAGAHAGANYAYRHWAATGAEPFRLTDTPREDGVFHSFEITSDGTDVLFTVDDDIVGALPGKAMPAQWIMAGVGGPEKKFHFDDVRFVASDTISFLDSVYVVPSADTLDAVTDTLPLTAYVLATSGDTIPGLPLLWSSLDTNVATVDSAGLVTAVGRGTARIVANYRHVADTAYVEIVFDPDDFADGFEAGLLSHWTDVSTSVTHPEIIAVSDAPEGTHVFECDVSGGNVSGNDCSAEVRGLNPGARASWRFTFMAKDLTGTNTGGWLAGVLAGDSTEAPDRTSWAEFNVQRGSVDPPYFGYMYSAAPGVAQYASTAFLRDDGAFHGFEILSDGSDLFWRIDGDYVGARSGGAFDARLVVLGVAAPTSGLQVDDVRFLVSDSITVLNSLDITSATDTLTAGIGDTLKLAAQLLASNGDTIPDLPVNWGSLDTTVAAVDSTGLVAAVALGTTRIVASYRSTADTVQFVVVDSMTFLYDLSDFQSSMTTYVSWSSNIRTQYSCPASPIGEGRGGYYWSTSDDHCTVGWCSELLCCNMEIQGLEIFDFAVDVDPSGATGATLSVHTYTETDRSWWAQVGFDVFVNDTLVGSGISADRGAQLTVTISIEDPSILQQGSNNIFIVYNESRTGYGLLTKIDWVELELNWAGG